MSPTLISAISSLTRRARSRRLEVEKTFDEEIQTTILKREQITGPNIQQRKIPIAKDRLAVRVRLLLKTRMTT